MAKVTIKFQLERETSGALRYEEVAEDGKKLAVGEGAKIGTLYVRKSTFNSARPTSIFVTLDYAS